MTVHQVWKSYNSHFGKPEYMDAAHLCEVCLAFHLFNVSAVTGSTDSGLLEGVMQGQGTGLLPAHCVQEVRLRQGVPPPILPQPPPAPPPSIMMGSQTTNRVQGRRESMHKHFATAPRLKKQWVVYHRCLNCSCTSNSIGSEWRCLDVLAFQLIPTFQLQLIKYYVCRECLKQKL